MMRLWIVMVLATVVVIGCSSPTGEIQEVMIGPELEDCVGVSPMKCMVVDGMLFYEPIDDFDYEEGYEYRLKIKQYDRWPDREEPPQDASRYGYELVEVLSKTAAIVGSVDVTNISDTSALVVFEDVSTDYRYTWAKSPCREIADDGTYQLLGLEPGTTYIVTLFKDEACTDVSDSKVFTTLVR